MMIRSKRFSSAVLFVLFASSFSWMISAPKKDSRRARRNFVCQGVISADEAEFYEIDYARRDWDDEYYPGFSAILNYVANRIERTSSGKLNYTAAKGILGEAWAKTLIEGSGKNPSCTQYVRIEDLVRFWGCECTTKYGANKGIDQLFIPITVINKTAELDRSRLPIMNEAKFDKTGKLQLKQTKTRCQQMSWQWIGQNFGQLYEVDGDGYVHGTCVVQTQPTCAQKVKELLAWIVECINNEKVVRLATVIDDDGGATVHTIHDVERHKVRGTSVSAVDKITNCFTYRDSKFFDNIIRMIAEHTMV